jgi:hypothetical protein
VASVVSLDGFRIEVDEPLLPRLQSIGHQSDSPDDHHHGSKLAHNPVSRDGGESRVHRKESKSGLCVSAPVTIDRVRDKKRCEFYHARN